MEADPGGRACRSHGVGKVEFPVIGAEARGEIVGLHVVGIFVGPGVSRIEHLGGMVHLHTLFLQENSLEVIDGLGDCVALQRLWLSANRISALGDGLRPLHELRELWLQANPLASPAGLEGLASLQVLSLAGTRVSSLSQLELLRPVTALFDLSFDDGHYGPAPLASAEGYAASAVHLLPQLGVLDGWAIAAHDRSDADEALRTLNPNPESESLPLPLP